MVQWSRWHRYCSLSFHDKNRVYFYSTTPIYRASELAKSLSNRDKGLAFELEVSRIMKTYHCRLHPTQLSKDGGIDHHGLWHLPDSTPIEIITQCKHERNPVGVHHLRSFHGVMSSHRPHAVGMFFSSSGYSIYAERFFWRMTHPAILCTIELNKGPNDIVDLTEIDTPAVAGRLTSFLLNDRAQIALPNLTVGTSFVSLQPTLQLVYNNKILGC